MASAAQIRHQIDAILAQRTSARLALAPRLVAPGSETGYNTLDAVLHGGFPLTGTTEILGTRSSGRTSLAMAYLAERTREGYLCAWVDVAGDLAPEAALANGTDLDRVLWIRCNGAPEPTPASSPAPPTLLPQPSGMHLIASAFPEAKPNLRPYNPTSSRSVGPGTRNRPLASESQPARAVQVASDRQPPRRGSLVVQKTQSPPSILLPPSPHKPFVEPKKPWSRLEQAIKAVDLLAQAGGLGAIVLDLGAIAPQFTHRIPLATWFRWRAALEKSRSALIVLSQMSCAGSAAELALRVEAELPAHSTVLTGLTYRMEVVRRRFETQAPPRKPPTRASAWHSETIGLSS